jgi:hypothetical protein
MASGATSHQPNMYQQGTTTTEDPKEKLEARRRKVAAWLRKTVKEGEVVGGGDYEELFDIELEGRKFEVSVGKGVLEQAQNKEAGGRKWGMYQSSSGVYQYTMLQAQHAKLGLEGGGRSVMAEGRSYQGLTAYKPVGKKIHPVARAFTTEESTQLYRPPFSRNPYETPLVPNMPKFKYGGHLTKDWVDKIVFGEEGWLSKEEHNLLLGVLRLKEKAVSGSAEERGTFKGSYIEPVKIVTVPHKAWKERLIPSPTLYLSPSPLYSRSALQAGSTNLPTRPTPVAGSWSRRRTGN